MRNFKRKIAGVLACGALAAVAPMGGAAPAEAASSTILFSSSDYNATSFDCYVRNSPTSKTYMVNDGQDRKVNAKTGQVKCDDGWYARAFGRARGPQLKKNQWYRIGGQDIPLAWIVAESKKVALG